MKIRVQKKLRKKKALAAAPQPAASQTSHSAQLENLAIECWRIKKLVPEFSDNRKHLVLASTVDKMLEIVRSGGVEFDDPEGLEFRDGMTLDVALFEESSELPPGRRVIAETLCPAIYASGKLRKSAKVIVSVGVGKK